MAEYQSTFSGKNDVFTSDQAQLKVLYPRLFAWALIYSLIYISASSYSNIFVYRQQRQ